MAYWRRGRGARAMAKPPTRPALEKRAAVQMKSTAETHLSQGAAAPEDSRFEQFNMEAFSETSACAYFGRKLQKLFPLPAENSEPDDLRLLLRAMQAKLDESPVAAVGPTMAERENGPPSFMQSGALAPQEA